MQQARKMVRHERGFDSQDDISLAESDQRSSSGDEPSNKSRAGGYGDDENPRAGYRERGNTPQDDFATQHGYRIIAANFKRRAEDLQADICEHVETGLQELIDRCTEELEGQKRSKFDHANLYDEDGRKVFVARESILTELLQIEHIQTIYNVFVAVLLVFIMNTIMYDYLEHKRLVFDISLVTWAFGNLPSVITTWLLMLTYTLALYPTFQAFASNQVSQLALPIPVCLLGYAVYMGNFLYFPVHYTWKESLPIASGLIVICEQVRLMMKVHAFVRVNSSKVWDWKKSRKVATNRDTADPDVNMGEKELALPGFSQYLHFLFVPTLIYRDQYPTTPSIRWDFVVKNFAQVIACVFYVYYLFVRFCVPVFRNTGKEPGNIRALLLSAFSCMLPALVVCVLTFFALLHSWMNAFAEMTRFADRMFYRDWWNAKSFAGYYRMWNIVVHDWLHAYIYKDMLIVLGDRYKVVAAIAVFMISALVHEYILAVTMRFFFPALFIMFGGIGVGFFFIKTKKDTKNPFWNIFFWVSMTLGSGILMMLYSVEWYASRNCPRQGNSVVEYFVPRMMDSSCVQWVWGD